MIKPMRPAWDDEPFDPPLPKDFADYDESKATGIAILKARAAAIYPATDSMHETGCPSTVSPEHVGLTCQEFRARKLCLLEGRHGGRRCAFESWTDDDERGAVTTYETKI